VRVRSFFNALLGYFLTPGGVLLMGALDSSLVFFFPLGIDFVVIIMSARKPELFWLYAVLAAGGSVLGGAVTFWIGRKVGQAGLKKLVKPRRLRRIEERVTHGAAIGVAALGAIPPPFPFTAFVLASGAFGASAWRFLATLGGVRLARFAVEGWLAARYGKGILGWMESTVFEVIIGALIALAVLGTIASAVAVWKGTREPGSDAETRRSPRTDHA
jgi:membrane protein YqaA with SNARE-associated domain